MTEFMRSSDAFTWAMESDPRLRSTVVTVIMLDRSPDWGQVRNRFEVISRTVSMMSSKKRSAAETPVEALPAFAIATFLWRIIRRRVGIASVTRNDTNGVEP